MAYLNDFVLLCSTSKQADEVAKFLVRHEGGNCGFGTLRLEYTAVDRLNPYFVCYGTLRNQGGEHIRYLMKEYQREELFSGVDIIINYEDPDEDWVLYEDMTTGSSIPLFDRYGDLHQRATDKYPIEFLDSLIEFFNAKF